MKMKSITFQRLAALGSVAVLSLAISACGGKNGGGSGNGADAGSPVTGDWVVVHSLSDPETLNLVTATDATSQEIFGNYMYDVLLNTDPYTLETIPWVAETLPKVSDDKLTYEFTLRKDVKFSDGKPVTGNDFIFYLKMIKNPLVLNAAPLRGYFTRLDRLELIDNDPYRLRAVMKEPYYLADQFIGGLYAFPKHIWDPENLSDKISWDELNKSQTDKNPAIKTLADFVQEAARGFDKKFLVSSGPYMFSEFGRNDRVVLVRNPNYWNKSHKYGKAYPDRIIYRTINDPNAAVTALKNGELDMYPLIEKVAFNAVRNNLGDYGAKPAIYDYPTYVYIGYNERRPMFKDKQVRTALSYAVDRNSIIKTIYFGMARPVQSPIYFKRTECDTTLPIIPFDLEKAKKLLADAGWADTDGDGILDKVIDGQKTKFSFKILLNSGNKRREQIAIVFVDALKKIGIDANVSSLEWATFLQRTRDGDYDASIGGWSTSVQEGDLYQIWHSKSAEQGGSNYIRYSNPEVDKLIEAVRGEFDFEKRKAMYKQIQKLLYDDQPYTFLVSEKQTGAYSARYQGVEFFGPRPCYNAGWWWVPTSAQKYKTDKAVAVN